jgi:hypothetical protein
VKVLGRSEKADETVKNSREKHLTVEGGKPYNP